METSLESSADCIRECQKRTGERHSRQRDRGIIIFTTGCKYWTYVMGEKVNCFLKNNKGTEVGYLRLNTFPKKSLTL